MGRHSAGAEIKGTVPSLVAFGAFVQLAEGVDGLLHISDIKKPLEVRDAVPVKSSKWTKPRAGSASPSPAKSSAPC